MEDVIFSGVVAIIGAVMGSFAGAYTWRLRARQLVDDKKYGEEVEKKEYKKLLPLTKKTLTSDRSMCLHCGHQLAWYDLVPLVSWISTGGRCRYCHKKIGWLEPLIEVGLAVFFVVSYLFWPFSLVSAIGVLHFILWLVAGVLLAMLFVYDAKWFLLPNKIVFPLIGVAAATALLQIPDGIGIVSVAGSVVILSGLYLLLWWVSKGKWVGFGDIKLGLALALLLADWQLAFVALLAANLIGSLIVIPGMLSGRITRKTRVPLGPLLIVGSILAFFVGRPAIDWYMAILF